MILFQDPTLRLTPSWTNEKKEALVLNRQGLIVFRCAFWKGGVERAHYPAVSGQHYNQVLLRCDQRVSGCAAPIGEGIYALGDPDAVNGVNWARGVNNWTGSHGPGLGPWWVGIHPTKGYPCDTLDYGLHSDFNEETSAGTLGCTGIQGEHEPGDLIRLQSFNRFWQLYKPTRYVVDHGLGTVPRPDAALESDIHRVKLFVTDGKVRGYRDGVEVEKLTVRCDYHSSRYGLAINGVQLPVDSILGVSLKMAYRLGGVPPRPHSLKFYAHPGKVNAYMDGLVFPAMATRFALSHHTLEASVAEVRVPFNQLQSLRLEVAYKAGK